MSDKTSRLELMEPASPDLLIPDYGLWPWFAVAAAILAIIILAAWLFLRKKKSAIDPLTLRNAAFAEAIAALAGTTTDSAREAAVQSSLILRRYLSAAANDPALFETHEEFISRHDALQALTPETRATTGHVFARLAALKYAPEIPDASSTEVIAESRALLETLHHGFAA